MSDDTTSLRPLAENLWVTERPQRFFGIEIGTRTTVIRLDEGLLIYSPVRLDPGLKAEIDALGPVRWLVSPSPMHHLYTGDWTQAYPDAHLFGSVSVAAKRKDLSFDGTLTTDSTSPWGNTLKPVIFEPLDEITLLHPASRTMIVTDAIFNVGPTNATSARLFFRFGGCYDRPGITWIDRIHWLRDKDAARRSLRRILQHDFDRLIMAHGEPISEGGDEALRKGYTFLDL